MRSSLLSALSVCALCTGFAHSRPAESRVDPNDGARAAAPTPLVDPGRVGTPGSTDCRVARVAPPLTQLAQPEGNPRSAYPQTSAHPEITARTLSSSVAPVRDPAMFRIQPGEKGNKLPENAPGRNLSPTLTDPKTVPPSGLITPRRLTPGDTPPPQRTTPIDR